MPMTRPVKDWLAVWPYVLTLAVAYLLALPLSALAGDKGILIVGMLLMLPLTQLIIGIVYGWRHRFSWQLLVVSTVLFIAAMFLYLNETALVYLPIYLVLLLAGQAIGRFFRLSARRDHPEAIRVVE